MPATHSTSRRSVGDTIISKFSGFCPICRKPWGAGERITKVAEKCWQHEICAAAAGAVPTACDQSHSEPMSFAGQMQVEAIRQTVREELSGATLEVDQAEVRGVVRDELTKSGVTIHKIEVTSPGCNTRTIDGKAHAQLARTVRLAAARMNILLVGPAGSGKTHLASQVAEALGLPFAFISCSAGMSEGQLLGRLVPTGESGKFEYLRSEFVRCYEEGGVFLFDELDGADSNTLLVLNAALANGHMAIPNRPGNPLARKHKDFVCIAAANTFGTGADRQYVGRNQLDESTLDRFRIGQIEMDYDADVEAILCPDDALRSCLQGYRTKARAAKLRRIISMRFLRDAYDMKRAGDSDAEIDGALFAGWSKDEIAKVKEGN